MTTTPPTTTRPQDASAIASSSTSVQAQGQAPPEFVVTPATPNTPMHPSHSVPQSLPIPAEVKEDRAGEAAANGSTETTKVADDKTTTNVVGGEKKAITTENSTTPAASSSKSTPASKPTNTTARPASRSVQKKKKRSGLSGLLLRFGCLSADEFEDPEPKKGMVPKTASKPVSTAASTPKPAMKEVKTTPAQAAVAPKAEVPSAAGTTLAQAGEKDLAGQTQPAEEVVVAPQEPHTAPIDETAGLTSSAVQAPGSGSVLLATPVRPSSSRRQSESSPSAASPDAERTDTSGGYSAISDSEVPDSSSGSPAPHAEDDYGLDDEYEDEEDRLIAQGGMGIPVDEYGHPAPLLPPMDKQHSGRKCLVLDLDETLLHSSFKMLPSADYIVPVEIESQTHNVYVIKRPGVDHFLTEMGKIYEVVIFTASLSKYADPVLDMLDTGRVVRHRLFRESCYNHKGNYVKDLSQLGREMEDCIIIDNSPASYIFHPHNAVPVSTWFNDPHDTELTDLCPFLTDLATVDDIRGVLDGNI